MADTWGGSLRDVILRAIEEATARRASTVEAEHLLLAVAADDSLTAARVLADIGWDHDGIAAALDAERVRSLAVAGIAPVENERLTTTPRRARPGWGASARAAIRRAGLGVGRVHRWGFAETDLLLGILEAEIGTVPRMLAFAGIDRDDVVARLRGAAAA